MRAMVFEEVGKPLTLKDVPVPEPADRQVLIEIHACGVCRTDLHIIDGELPHPKLPLIIGHQIVGIITRAGKDVTEFKPGDRVGVPWLGDSCHNCEFCKKGLENLCDDAKYTGYDIDGGFAEYTVANAGFIFPIPEGYPDLQAAPLLCAGLIGYRSYRFTGDAKRVGMYGFGSAAHIITQVAKYHGREVYAFTRPGDTDGQEFARSMGAVWAGGSDESPPELLDAAIIFAPVGPLVPAALKALKKGGIAVCAGIYMSDIPSFAYSILWGERSIKSVANLTRRDGEEFLKIAPKVPVKTDVNPYPLEKANEALDDLRHGRFHGAAVLMIKD
jgi:propanol-preferring alcohol dehydrogenase